jgi:ABC-type Zn uptake system ZnuABC Zn-binding protein ZnuA
MVPGEAESCLVVLTESLSAEEHDSFMKVIESNAGQTAVELADAMNRSTLPDGRNMFIAFHKFGKIQKYPTKDIEMTPDMVSSVNLAELNQIIADQKGVTIHELAGGAQPEDPKPAEDLYTAQTEAENYASDGVLSDEDLAAQYRSQADALFKEAKKLREQAEELVPTKRKTTKKTEESAEA